MNNELIAYQVFLLGWLDRKRGDDGLSLPSDSEVYWFFDRVAQLVINGFSLEEAKFLAYTELLQQFRGINGSVRQTI